MPDENIPDLEGDAITEIASAISDYAYYANYERGYDHAAASQASDRLSEVCKKHNITRRQAEIIHWADWQKHEAERRASYV